MRPLRMVPMTSLPPFQARLLAARLGAEGILWQLRGESAVYPIAAVEVLVEAGEVERARALLEGGWGPEPGSDPEEATSIPAGLVADRSVAPGPPGDGSPPPRSARPMRPARAVAVWLVLALVLVALALRVSHLG